MTTAELERQELDERDLALLKSWRLSPDHPDAREMVLIGRLQDKLGLETVDGRYGPHTQSELTRARLPLGPELQAIVIAKSRPGWEPGDRIFDLVGKWLLEHPSTECLTKAHTERRKPFELRFVSPTGTLSFNGDDMRDAYAQAAQAIVYEAI